MGYRFLEKALVGFCNLRHLNLGKPAAHDAVGRHDLDHLYPRVDGLCSQESAQVSFQL